MNKNLLNANEKGRLTERIAARKLKNKPSQAAINNALFLALKAEIKEAMDDGHNVFCIWETLHEEEKLKFSYETFRKYVKRIIHSPSDSAKQQMDPVAINTGNTNTAQKSTKKEEVTQPKNSGIPGFVYNPIPNKEDLF